MGYTLVLSLLSILTDDNKIIVSIISIRRLISNIPRPFPSLWDRSKCYIAIYMNMRNVHGMFITYIHNVGHIKNIGISKFENTKRLLVQVRNLFINFELKVST